MSDVYRLVSGTQRPALSTQAASSIRTAIHEGRWHVGDRLPAEPQLATELRISRATLREAVRMLVSDGLLDRRHGVGTFVIRVPTPTIERGIDELFSLGDAIEQLGYAPTVGDHDVAVETGPVMVTDELRTPPDAPVVHLTRVRLADGRPVILCDDFFVEELLHPHSLTPQQAADEIVAQGSLYRWFEERLGLPIDTALTHIEPRAANARTAKALGLPAGGALLVLRQTHYTAEGTPVLYSENVHNSDVIHFHVQRRRHRPSWVSLEKGEAPREEVSEGTTSR